MPGSFVRSTAVHTDHILGKLLPLVESALSPPRDISVPAIPRSAEALLAWCVHSLLGRTVVWVGDGQRTLDTVHLDLSTLAPGPDPAALVYYPASDVLPNARNSRVMHEFPVDPELAGRRLIALLALADLRTPVILATCVQALMQGCIGRADLEALSLQVDVGDTLDMNEAVSVLEQGGYEFAPEVYEKAQATTKGGLLDVWPSNEQWPVRIEFFGDRVESIRRFDPSDQVSVKRLQSIAVPPASDAGPAGNSAGPQESPLSYLPGDAVFIWSDPDSIEEYAQIYEEAAEGDARVPFVPLRTLRRRVGRRQSPLQITVGGGSPVPRDLPAFSHVPGVLEIRRDIAQPDLVEGARQRLLAELEDRVLRGQDVFVYFDTQGALDHFAEIRPGPPPFATRKGMLSEGFICEELGLVVVAEGDLYGRKKLQGGRHELRGARRPAADVAGSRITDLASLEPGDLVVHAEHGIGCYRGLFEIEISGRKREVLSIEYAEGAKLHVPVTQSHLLSRYTGISRHRVSLHRLGGKRWARERMAAEESILDLASSLLETQAQRELLEGHVFPPDTHWQREFEASFPYRETSDQSRAIRTVKRSMESSRPMDLLICGDAGYGKTEVAMRAAFKAAMDGKQVAVLVPTTVLAQQHFDTFKERMSPYPVRIAMLSRFCRHSERRTIIQDLARGAIDIVIGTHALVQPSVAFGDLGLVVIDEEQRFGVRHKEWLKDIRRLVDVLTMTATPIPRTLYLSMTGARDMSLVQTPPRDRTPIETVALKTSDKVVRSAILRELARKGQVFYLHNRVMTIDSVRHRLAALVPEARIGVAHGQMPSGELSRAMRAFIAGRFDVLLCTTIIESGTDIPRANTILIDRADRFGLADLYQLRGRVGRSRHKGYAYLLLPPHSRVEEVARRRIDAVMRHSSLGAGFNLALRDLEIRGAGNMLGTQQSGHINAIGFGLYCQLLNRTISRLRGEEPSRLVEVEVRLDFLSFSADAAQEGSAATIPYEYIEDEQIRLGAYRRIAECDGVRRVDDLREELTDRFGAMPPSLDRLLRLCVLRIVCADAGIRQVETRDTKAMFLGADAYLMSGGRFPRLTAETPTGKLEELIQLARTGGEWSGNGAQ